MDLCRPTFYPNQIAAGDDVVALFHSTLVDDGTLKTYYTILEAAVQVGKTGTYNYIAQQMLELEVVDRVYILCGSHETELRDQAIADSRTYNKTAFDEGRLKVIFRGAFKHHYPSGSSPLNMERTLIIVDESHLDQTRGQEMSQLLAEYGLNMSGTLPIMEEKKTYILSVDATPYSELAALYSKSESGGKSLSKNHIVLQPGEGYFGLLDYKREGLLKRMRREITLGNREYFRGIIRTHCGVSGNEKYAIIRAEGKKLATLLKILESTEIQVRSFTTKKTDISIADLSTKPDAPTVVFVCGRLRAGKVVPKEHIGFVWETSDTPNTDVLIQGLWGRMCGYQFGETKPLIILSQSIDSHCVTDIKRFSKGLKPLRATNVSGTHREHNWCASERFQCPPIRLTPKVRGDDAEYVDLPTAIASRKLSHIRTATHTLITAESDFANQILEASFLTTEQKNEILERLVKITADDIHVRRMQNNSEREYFMDLLRAEIENTSTLKHCSLRSKLEGNDTLPHLRKHPYFNVIVVCDDRAYKSGILPELADTFNDGSAWMVCYTDAPSMEEVRYKGPTHGEENKKSIFSIHSLLEKPDSELSVGLYGLHGFRDAAFTNSRVFQEDLRLWVDLWHRGKAVVPVLRASPGESFQFSKLAFAHESAKKNRMVTLVKEIEREFQCKIHVTFGKGRTSATHFKVEEIVWHSV